MSINMSKFSLLEKLSLLAISDHLHLDLSTLALLLSHACTLSHNEHLALTDQQLQRHSCILHHKRSPSFSLLLASIRIFHLLKQQQAAITRTMAFSHVADGTVVDIGGSSFVETDLALGVKKAFLTSGDTLFPKELAYSDDMEAWDKAAANSNQTIDEPKIIKKTARAIVEQMPKGTTIHLVDLGAANSTKYQPYVEEANNLGLDLVYVPLDLDKASLEKQVVNFKTTFPSNRCVALWGSFEHGDAYYPQIPGARIFLSLGSIFFNGPDDVCNQRCNEFAKNLRSGDCLIVGQDQGSNDLVKVQASYSTPAYNNFIWSLIQSIHDKAGIATNPKEAWEKEHHTAPGIHEFIIKAKTDLICKHINDHLVHANEIFSLFPSWKPAFDTCANFAQTAGLNCKLIGREGTMYQCKVTKK